jgi:hypothetical protein
VILVGPRVDRSVMTRAVGRTEANSAHDEALARGVEAYIYLSPLVTMEVTRRQMTNLPPGVSPPLAR